MSTPSDFSRERRRALHAEEHPRENHVHTREALPNRERVGAHPEEGFEYAPTAHPKGKPHERGEEHSLDEGTPETPPRKETFLKKAGKEVVEYLGAFKEAWGHGTPLERAAMVVASIFITFSFLPLYIPLGLVVAYSAPELAAPYFIFANDQVLLVIGAAIMLMGPKCIRDLTMKHIKNLIRWVKRLGKSPEQET